MISRRRPVHGVHEKQGTPAIVFVTVCTNKRVPWLATPENHSDDKWSYVRENPVRAGLVARAEDWPYQGELNVLDWS
jgi:hypothetical protein